MENKAYTYIFNDILGKVLQLSETPSQFADYLTQQISQLIGARTVLIAIKTESEPIKIFGVFPARRKVWVQQNAVQKLIRLTGNFETIQYLNQETSEEKISSIFKELEIDTAIVIPLIAANHKVGSILLLDIMDSYGIESVIELLTRLSGVFALVIRNSNFYQNMENMVALRTSELQKRNEELEEAKIRAERSETQIRDILQTAMDGYWNIDMKGRFIEVNEIACKMLGYSREEMLSMTISDIEFIEESQQVEDHIEKIFKNSGDWFETKHRCKDGKIIDVEVNAICQPSQNLIVTFVSDITERKQAEESVQISYSRLKALLKTPQDIIMFLLDKQYNYIIFNDKHRLEMKRQFHVDIAEGLNMLGLFTQPQFKTNVENNFKRVLRGEAFEEVHVMPDLNIYYQFFWNPVIKEDGEIIGISCFVIDITKAKKVEEDLINAKRAAEEIQINIQSIIENTLDNIWSVNLNFELTYINQMFKNGFFETFGLKLNIGDVLIEKLPEPLQTVWMQYYSRALNNEIFTIEDEIQIGSITKYVQISINPIISQEKIIGISFFGREITQQRQREIELILAKENALESDRLKSAFLANMSHEIRTPMNGILGFAELLKEPGLSGEEQQEYISIIERSGARMLNTINDIVDISKIESGLMKLDLKESNVNDQIEYIYTFFKPEVEAKGIRLSFMNSLPAKEAIIQTDREKLYAILTNLAKNAIKYTEKGSIELGYTMVQSPDRSSVLQFYVKDSGIGIPKNRQKAIFDRFVQADIEDKRAHQGSGLGLTITRSYVEMLGGQIWVESEEGYGSTFYFTLPYKTLQAENASYKKISLAEGEENINHDKLVGLKILIAEDDEISEKFISILAKGFGKELLKARTGQESVDICRNNPDLDLILMDIQMPEMSGYEATRKIREFNKKVVIIAQTAYGLSGDREKAIEAGCNDYITKPINAAKLTTKIQKYFKT